MLLVDNSAPTFIPSDCQTSRVASELRAFKQETIIFEGGHHVVYHQYVIISTVSTLNTQHTRILKPDA